MISGQCNCGEVSFEVHAAVEDVFVCHCSICRRSTGGSGIAVTIVNCENFVWVSGVKAIKTWRKPNHDWETSFCQSCGTPVPGRNDAENMYIPVSLLGSGVENLKVAHHLFVGSKATWEEIGDSGRQHTGAYGE